MLKTDVHRLIDSFKLNGSNLELKHNVLSQASMQCKSGKWLVPDDKYSLFLNKISDVLTNNSKSELHFLEVPNEKHNMVKVDIDLRFKATEEELKQKANLNRRYTENLIDLIINILAIHLNELINTPNEYKIYIQEKLSPRIAHQEKTIKDGIHIIIPDLVLSNQALYYLREQIVDNEDLQEHMREIGNISELPDVIDKRIIYPNAWYIYGCGKPDDKGDVYKVTKIYKIVKEKTKQNGSNNGPNNGSNNGSNNKSKTDEKDDYSIKMIQPSKNTLKDWINLFSNFGKKPNVEYQIDFDEEEKYNNDKNSKYLGKESEALFREYVQDQNNFRRASTLTQEEIKPYLDCLKKKRADDYEDWFKVGLSLFNMDHRNYELWKTWSKQSPKFDEGACRKKWYNEFPKAGKYNMSFNKIKEIAKQDNIEKFRQIININKKNFFRRWIHAHIEEKDVHGKNVSISTITKFIYSYIMDYASFNIACALPGASQSCVYYKFDKHKWTKDEGANKVYMLLSETVKNELTKIHLELKEKMIAMQRSEHEQNRSRHRGNTDDEESIASYQRYIVDDREEVANPEQLSADLKDKMYTKQQSEKCAELIQFLSKPANKKTVIEDLSQKCYDEEFYKKLDDNTDVFVCTNGVLDMETCIFRDGQPSDMMTMSSNVEFPKNIDSVEAQEIMCAIQDWLDKIFPDDDVQAYVLNTFACKLSGKLFGEKFHIFTGSGANGKSQFFKMMKEIFGDYYQQSDNTLLNTPKRDANAASPAIAQLKSKHICVMTEPKNNQPFESDKVKELVSGDPMTCRHLNKDPIQFVPQYAMFLQCNDIPKNETTDDGFWRKIFIVPCEAKFITNEDHMYKLEDPVKYPNHFRGQDQSHLYKQWAPYFLYLLFERYKELKACKFNYPVPDKMKVATREYQEEANIYGDFFKQKIEEAPGYKVDAATLYTEFQQFIARDFKTNKGTFLKQMERIIGKPKGRNKEYHGFRIVGTSGEEIEEMDANASINMDE